MSMSVRDTPCTSIKRHFSVPNPIAGPMVGIDGELILNYTFDYDTAE